MTGLFIIICLVSIIFGIDKIDYMIVRILSYFLISILSIGLCSMYYKNKNQPTAEDLLRGKVKIEVVETKINGELVKKDTIYSLIDSK